MPNKKAPQILSPAGSWVSLVAAVQNNCDAVYLGGQLFSARSLAQNFTNEELVEAIDYCHKRQVKVYITVNTLYKNVELPLLFGFLNDMYRAGADAFIFQDMGAATTAMQTFPDIPIHASTQMTAHSVNDGLFLQTHGFARVVLSRELSVAEIKQITQECDLETEIFCHGALCVCNSGQCYMSSMLGGRSGNRGKCAQPCRLPYRLLDGDDVMAQGYLLSPKDLMTLTDIHHLVNINVSALKIEGRMKGAEYVAITTALYHKYAHNPVAVSPEEIKQLTQVFNRGGSFTQGYLHQQGGSDMMSFQTPKSLGALIGYVDSYKKEHSLCTFLTREALVPGDGIEIWTQQEPHTGTGIKRAARVGEWVSLYVDGDIAKGDGIYKSYDKTLLDKLQIQASQDRRKMDVTCHVQAHVGQPLCITLTGYGVEIIVEGQLVSPAVNQPLTAQKLCAQISKTGATTLAFVFGNVEIDENIYIPIIEINKLRRDACNDFLTQYLTNLRRIPKRFALPTPQPTMPEARKFSVSLLHPDQFDASMFHNVFRVYLEISEDMLHRLDELVSHAHAVDTEVYIALPHFMFDEDVLTAYLTQLEKSDIDGYLVRSYGQLRSLQASTKALCLDEHFNVTNHLTLTVLSAQAQTVTLSPELTLQEVNSFATDHCEIVVHGRQRLMTTRQCPVGNTKGNKKSGKYCALRNSAKTYSLIDRKRVQFPVVTDCDNCLAHIYNGKLLYTADKREILEAAAGLYRLAFVTEDADEIRQTLAAYTNGRLTALPIEKEERTLGHFFRGIE